MYREFLRYPYNYPRQSDAAPSPMPLSLPALKGLGQAVGLLGRPTP
jgi:hypothetical protein